MMMDHWTVKKLGVFFPLLEPLHSGFLSQEHFFLCISLPNYFFRVVSSSSSCLVLPWIMICHSIFCIHCSRDRFSWNMSPKTVLFQIFSFCLKFFNFCWNLYMRVPWDTSTFFHQVGVFYWKYGWVSQNISNMKGLFSGKPTISNQRWIG